MTVLNVAVSWAPYPEGSPRAAQQRQAFTRLAEIAPSWCSVTLTVQAREKAPVVPVPAGGLQVVVLPRDASSVAGGRRLPFFRDMLDVAVAGLPPDGWGGILNSDIVVTQEFFDLFERLNRDMRVVICHRTDVRHLDTDPGQGQKVNQRTCTDGVFVRPDMWAKHRLELPDYILGEPLWDTGFIFWTKLRKLPTFHMGNHELLHVRHGRFWSYRSPGSQYNSNLGKKLWKFGTKGDGSHER